MTHLNQIAKLENRLKHRFANPNYLAEALCHRSYLNEQPDSRLRDNERLEFLGDAVINLIIAHILMNKNPQMNEGELSQTRANLVNEYLLAELARDIHLGAYLLLGKGEISSNGQDKNSILADAFEAVLGAVYLDGGFEAAFHLLNHHFPFMIKAAEQAVEMQDFKSRLQEMVQLTGKSPPTYRVVETSGPDHDKTFTVRVETSGITTKGSGKSKKLAEQDAAGKALIQLASETSP